MKKILYQINTVFKQKLFLQEKNNILCGVSGGQDSILLVILLLHFEKKYNFNLQILYCHHFWQRTNFAALWLIWKLAFLFKIPIYVILTEKSLMTENRAREWRHESYQRITLFSNCNKLSLGHTASDRIETAFWHLIRGSSLKGLTSIQWEKKMQTSSLSNFFPSYNFLNSNRNIIISTKKTKKLERSLNKFSRKNSWSLLKKKSKIFPTSPTRSKYSCKWSVKHSLPVKVTWIGINRFALAKKQSFSSQTEYSFKNKVFKSEQPGTVLKTKLTGFYNNSFVFTFQKKSAKKIIRPLLGLHRSDITKFIDSSQLPILNDSSNQTIKLQRNKIRYQLLPTVRYSFNPKVDYLLNQFLEISTDEFSFIKNVSRRIFDIHSLKKISPVSVQRLPISLQRDLILSIFLKTQGLVLSYSQIEIIRFGLSVK